jgi:predicted 3-demethylubiquinone-9 3-methyltransferase (glyoxalase superfamily)
VAFELWGHPFRAISAGPMFTFNPSISLMVNFDPAQDPDAAARIETVWEKLVEGGQVLMPLDTYPFSARYGWLQDRYGLSWQLILTNPEGELRPPILTSLLFVGDVCGKAEAATDLYLSLFPGSRRGALTRWPGGMAPEKEGTLMFTDFQLAGKWFTAQDSAHAHQFAFNEAISFMVNCETQDEIDFYWEKLSAVPEAEQCGWLKDPYGVSWQIVPTALDEMMSQGTPAQVDRVTQTFLPMKKLDIAKLQEAFAGE